MKEKAVIVWNFLRKVLNFIWEFIKKYAEIIALIVVIILMLYTDIFNKQGGKGWDAPLIGVVLALVVGLKQIATANKNAADNIQIRRAEFTNKFVKEFQKLMPEMDFCAFLYERFNEYCGEKEEIKEMQKKLLERDRFNFSIREYNNLKRELGINDSVLEKARNDFKKDTVHIIAIAEEHYKEKGLSEFCSFHRLHDQYLAELLVIESDFKSTRSKDGYDKQIKNLQERYVNSIFVNIKNVVNVLECNTLSVQFDLLDYDKITNLIYVPLYYYVSNLYIVMMENKIEHEKRNYYIYSNIKRLCSEVVKIKSRINFDMDLESAISETNRDQIITNSTKTKKL